MKSISLKKAGWIIYVVFWLVLVAIVVTDLIQDSHLSPIVMVMLGINLFGLLYHWLTGTEPVRVGNVKGRILALVVFLAVVILIFILPTLPTVFSWFA